ncbi:MAG: (deoxy)nucleoside triphosphate pyrophosphohydrolase [Betaproteobacteria bacterium]|nr:(deoxy)nucleoside triphosphate pyrophosphohydrolase [Betaproteobacteria bacterium]
MHPNQHIHVTCAIIERDGLVLAAQRSATMSMPLKWEFPGGKVDAGESLEDCLRRELAEELGVHVKVGQRLSPTTYQYPTFAITLYPFICSIESGELTLHEHGALMWLPPEELHGLDWAEADLPIINAYRKEQGGIAT